MIISALNALAHYRQSYVVGYGVVFAESIRYTIIQYEWSLLLLYATSG